MTCVSSRSIVRWFAAVLLGAASTAAQAQDPTPGRGAPPVGPGAQAAPRDPSGFFLRSPAFGDGARIPDKFTVEGEDRSPPLKWGNAPKGTASFALICEDLDTRGRPFVHWVIYGLPADLTELPEGLPRDRELTAPVVARQGTNNFPKEKDGYRGPATPRGDKPHRYRFTLYALKAVPEVKGGLTAEALRGRMKDLVLAETSFIGTYSRARKPGDTPPGEQAPEMPRPGGAGKPDGAPSAPRDGAPGGSGGTGGAGGRGGAGSGGTGGSSP